MNNILAQLPTGGTVVDLYRRLAEDDLVGAVDLLHPDVVLHVPGSHPLAGDHEGVDAVARFVLACRTLTEGTESTRLLDLAYGSTLVSALCLVTAERAGRAPLANETLHLHRVVDGRIVDITFQNADQATVDAFWGES